MIFLSVDNLQYILIVMKSSEMILSSTRMYVLQSTSCEHSRELSEGNAGFAESRSIVCLSIPWCYPPPPPPNLPPLCALGAYWRAYTAGAGWREIYIYNGGGGHTTLFSCRPRAGKNGPGDRPARSTSHQASLRQILAWLIDYRAWSSGERGESPPVVTLEGASFSLRACG
jgi:hypothetical protein